MSDLLLVDNDGRIVDLLAFFLGKRGHRVRSAASYAAARVALRERAPELMLADLDLGAERGDVELPRLAAEGLLPPTLVVSGYLDGPTEERLLALAGVVGTLRKPFDLTRLEAALGRALERAAHVARADREAHADPDTSAGHGWVDVVPWARREDR